MIKTTMNNNSKIINPSIGRASTSKAVKAFKGINH